MGFVKVEFKKNIHYCTHLRNATSTNITHLAQFDNISFLTPPARQNTHKKLKCEQIYREREKKIETKMETNIYLVNGIENSHVIKLCTKGKT